jgi:hypothetical protein
MNHFQVAFEIEEESRRVCEQQAEGLRDYLVAEIGYPLVETRRQWVRPQHGGGACLRITYKAVIE